MIICNKCGTENPDSSIYCAKCGNKLTQEDSAQPEEVTNQSNNTDNINTKSRYSNIINSIKTHKKFYIIIPVILIIIGGFLYYYSVQKAYKEYQTNYAKTVLYISEETALQQDMCNLLSDEWGSAIDNQQDMNDAINKQIDGWKQDGTLTQIKNSKNGIETLMKKLQNPPNDYKQAYNLLVELFGVYSQSYEEATAPQGSLVSYNNDVHDKESNFTNILNKITVIQPNIKNQVKVK